MKDLREIVNEQKEESPRSFLKYKVLAWAVIILLLYVTCHTVHLDFRFIPVLNEAASKFLHFIFEYIVTVIADPLRGLWPV